MTKKYAYIFFILTLLLLNFIFSAVSVSANEKSREVTAFGLSKKEAVANALIEAVQQVKGLEISGIEKLRSSFMEIDISDNAGNKNSSAMMNSQNQEVLKQTQGIISSYEVISIHKAEGNNGWEALVRVHIPVYETPGISPHNRRKIAVIPFRTMQSSYNFGGKYIPSSEISRRFTQRLVTEMTQARKFSVLDREYMEEFLREKHLILSPDSPVNEQMKIGQVLGVDYLLIGTITEAAQKVTPYTIQVTGETRYDYSASLSADYRIIVMATRQIKWSDSIAIFLGNNEIDKISGRKTSKIQDALFTRASKKIVDNALNNIYPLRIVQVQANGELILNQGGVTLKKGEILDVFSTGEKIIDPYTGESLGESEAWAATVEITRVNPKASYANIVKGQLGDIKIGSICRRKEQQQTSTPKAKVSPGKKTDVQTSAGGGVILPFD